MNEEPDPSPIVRWAHFHSRSAKYVAVAGDFPELQFADGVRIVAVVRTELSAAWNDLMLAWTYKELPWNGLITALDVLGIRSFNPLDEFDVEDVLRKMFED